MLLLVFVLGIGTALVLTKHFIFETHKPDHLVSINSHYCDLSCCLPENIKLSHSQQAKIQLQVREYCQCRDTLSTQIDQKRLSVANLLLQSHPDLSAISSLLEDIAKLQKELELKTISHVLEVKNQLTPEQQDQFIKPIVNEIRRRCYHGELLEGTH
jgi:hypothetical protein